MPIDWSKYGVKSDASASDQPTVKTSVDFSKYLTSPEPAAPQAPTFAQERAQLQQKYGAVPSVNVDQSPLMQQIQQTPVMQGPPAPASAMVDQSRQLPIIGPILRGLDAVSNSPVLNRFDYAAGKAMGVPDNMMTATPESTGNAFADKAIGLIGGTVGYLTNPAQLEQSVGQSFFENPVVQGAGNRASGAVTNALSNLTGADVSKTLESKLLSGAAKGATVGGLGAATYAPFQTLIGGGNEQDIPQNILDQGAQGALLGGAFGGLGVGIGEAGRAANTGLSNLADKYAGTPIGEVLSNYRTKSIYSPDVMNQAATSRNVNNIGEIDNGAQNYANRYNFINRADNQPLALPPNAAYDRAKAIQESGNVLPTNEQPIYAGGQTIYDNPSKLADTFGLPQGTYTPPTRLRVKNGEEAFQSAYSKVLPVAQERMTPPLENENELAKWVQQGLNDAGHDVSLNQVRELNYEDLRTLAEEMKTRMNPYDVVRQTAHDMGYGKIFDQTAPSLRDRIAQDAQSRVYGVPARAVNVNEPQFNIMHENGASPARQQVEVKPSASPRVSPTARMPQDNVTTREERPIVAANDRTSTNPIAGEVRPANAPVEAIRERGFTSTVRQSEGTPQPLRQAMAEPDLYKTRNTQKLYDDAQKYIEKNGTQGAYDFVMGAKKVTDRHNAVAQILAKQLANSGDISRAIDVVSKTAKAGTELGRAIQALSLWNRMDTEGALLLAQRQVNKANLNEFRALTPEEAQPVVSAAQKIQQVEQTKSLAQEVADIVASKQPGEKLTDEELAKIKEFQKQVNDINGKVKSFLPDKAATVRKTIEEVNKIPPGERTIDQLKDYWEARAERARQKLNKQRNVGLLPNTENPVLLYAELGVAKIARGALNLADFTNSMVQDYGEKVKPIINQVYNHSLNLFRKSQGLPTTNELNQVVNRAVKNRELDEETAAQFKNWANKIAFYTDNNMRTEAVQDLQLALRKLGKSTLGEKVSSLQAGAQLLSIPTTVRNVIGNEAFNALEKLNKVAAVPIDWAVSKLTGERSVVFNPYNQEKYWPNWFKGGQGGWRGVSVNGKLSSYDIRPEVFGERNPLKYVTKLTGAELQSFDHAAYMRAYGDVLATYAEQLGKVQGLSGKTLKEAVPNLIQQLDQSIYDMADEAGRYATFQDDTILSKAAEGIKKGLNFPTKVLGDALVNKGIIPERLNPSGFGLGDVVLKYAKTPANIVMRALDYSPIGILRGVMEMAPILTKREFNQRQAVLALSRGITGTLGMTGLGYYLANQGILSGAQSNDYDVKTLQTAAGQKGYQVNLSALKRWITNGLSKDAAKYQNGDTLINYDWLQPMAISLAMGVNANQAIQDRKAGANVSVAKAAIIGGLQTIMNQPLVQGLQQVADATGNLVKYGSWSGFANILKGVPASFVPALSGQIRNFADNTSRSTYDPSVLKAMVNMVMNKIPGLAEKLPPQLDSLGNEKQVVDSGQAMTGKQAFNVFVNPAKVTSYHVSPEAAMVVQLINDTGNNRVAPRVPQKYLMVGKQKVNLTPDQYQQLSQSTGQYTATQLQRMAPMLTNPNVPETNKVNAVVKVLDDAGKRARSQLERQYPELRPKPKAAR